MNKSTMTAAARKIINNARRYNRPNLAGVYRMDEIYMVTDAFRILAYPADLPGLPVVNDYKNFSRSIMQVLNDDSSVCNAPAALPPVEELKQLAKARPLKPIIVGSVLINPSYLLDMIKALGPTIRAFYDGSNAPVDEKPFPGLYFVNDDGARGLLLGCKDI